jgi:hypothetical protein
MVAHWHMPECAKIRVRLQPSARVNEITLVDQGTVRVRVTAPPVDGKANLSMISLIAEKLGIPRSRITIAQGIKARNKLLIIDAIASSEALRQLT